MHYSLTSVVTCIFFSEMEFLVAAFFIIQKPNLVWFIAPVLDHESGKWMKKEMSWTLISSNFSLTSHRCQSSKHGKRLKAIDILWNHWIALCYFSRSNYCTYCSLNDIYVKNIDFQDRKSWLSHSFWAWTRTNFYELRSAVKHWVTRKYNLCIFVCITGHMTRGVCIQGG